MSENAELESQAHVPRLPFPLESTLHEQLQQRFGGIATTEYVNLGPFAERRTWEIPP